MDYIWQIFNVVILFGIGVFIYNLFKKRPNKN